MEIEKYVSMAKSLACLMTEDEIIEILLGEGWTSGEITEFMEFSTHK